MRTLALAVLLLAGWPLAVAADIYKYTDAQGIVRYTYDLAEVPENQRPGVQSYEEAVTSDSEVPPVEQNADKTEEGAEGEQGEDSVVVDEKKIEELKQKKKELDQEFAGLMEEKYKLLKEKQKLETLAGRDVNAAAEYDKKVEDLNRKIADFQKRQDVFQKEAQAVEKALEKSDGG